MIPPGKYFYMKRSLNLMQDEKNLKLISAENTTFIWLFIHSPFVWQLQLSNHGDFCLAHYFLIHVSFPGAVHCHFKCFLRHWSQVSLPAQIIHKLKPDFVKQTIWGFIIINNCFATVQFCHVVFRNGYVVIYCSETFSSQISDWSCKNFGTVSESLAVDNIDAKML